MTGVFFFIWLLAVSALVVFPKKKSDAFDPKVLDSRKPVKK